ncbi:glycoside hydrolase family 3 N-terminal domain-containing protein [Sphingobium sp.]|uniref:beta-glucosidase family protein n=1 Tax=Sphingobium sp. TaxID=1912891 RepID=UPI002617B8C7|nr:glycoside hydrolase family 3 N-terminal domain-containing protein [Sphingobium sp.]
MVATAALSWALIAAEPAHGASQSWMNPDIVAKQRAARSDADKEAVAAQRTQALIAAMTLDQKLQQLTGSEAEVLPELPDCFGGRHISGIADLAIPTFRVSNGPVGVGQNDCVAPAARATAVTAEDRLFLPYVHSTSARATALPSGMAVAASFDPQVADAFGGLIATEMNNLALHVFEAPGLNLARLPILGRNFEYFGEDPYLTGVMGVAETKAVQSRGLIAMAKHFVANEQETNRKTIQETIDDQVLRELYLIPFEMNVKDGHVGGMMCSYNFLNGFQACDNKAMLTGVLRDEWNFTGYVQSDFWAMKSSEPSLLAGTDQEMPTPIYWASDKLKVALNSGRLKVADIDTALSRRYRQMFKAGIFDRPLVQTPIDFKAGGKVARDIGARGAVLLQNNGALPIASTARTILLVGKATQPYAQQAIAGGAILGKWMGSGRGSSDVVPNYMVSPIDGLRHALEKSDRSGAGVKLLLVDDDNASATLDGTTISFERALAEVAGADSVIVMAGTNADESADRATFEKVDGRQLAASAAAGLSLDWYAASTSRIATIDPAGNLVKSSRTVDMIKSILSVRSKTGRSMPEKTALILKDNASVAMDPALLGEHGPAILEVWFPGQEDGNIVADLVLGNVNPTGRLPVTFPVVGKGFLDHVTPQQFPGVLDPENGKQTVSYSEGLAIGYRWYDANISGICASSKGVNPCVAFPFGHGLSYSRFQLSGQRMSFDSGSGLYQITVDVKNVGQRPGAETVQLYLSLPDAANDAGMKQPPKRLVGFAKADLDPGQTKSVPIVLDPAASHHPLSVWSKKAGKWVLPSGRYTIWVGTSASSHDLVRAGTFDR